MIEQENFIYLQFLILQLKIDNNILTTIIQVLSIPGFFLFKQFEFKLLLYICLNYNLFIMENQQEERTFTQQEVDAKKDEMLKFYTESLTYLEAQLKYETTLMQIDEVRFKRAQYQVQYAMMMAPPEDEQEENEIAVERVNPETLARKLKKQ